MGARAGLGRAGVLEGVRELGPEESIGGRVWTACGPAKPHLPQDEEARRHALPAWDGVALGGGGAEQLEVLLGCLEVLARVELLAERQVGHALEDVLLYTGGGGGSEAAGRSLGWSRP